MNLHLGYVLRRYHIHAGPGCIGQQDLTDVYGGWHHDAFQRADNVKNFLLRAVDLDRVEASIVLDAAGHLDDFALAHIRMIPVDVLNDPFRAAQQPGLISVNGCLMADLTGQVCAEAIDGRQYSGVGGQLDFVRAAARSVGGRSFLCLHSTHEAPDGTLTSNIRAHLPSGAVVTTPRSDVMYIVTEWGAADLHNQPLETRICAMIRIAHPRFRCALAQEAVAWGQLSPECAAQFDTQPEPEEEETT